VSNHCRLDPAWIIGTGVLPGKVLSHGRFTLADAGFAFALTYVFSLHYTDSVSATEIFAPGKGFAEC
jgi:hypothetical protein